MTPVEKARPVAGFVSTYAHRTRKVQPIVARGVPRLVGVQYFVEASSKLERFLVLFLSCPCPCRHGSASSVTRPRGRTRVGRWTHACHGVWAALIHSCWASSPWPYEDKVIPNGRTATTNGNDKTYNGNNKGIPARLKGFITHKSLFNLYSLQVTGH